MKYVAHRAGNSADLLKAAEPIADIVEVDVHLGPRRQVEVRHGKRLWPTTRLWEKWYLLPRDTPVPSLDDILDAAEQDTALWLDLKGPDPRLSSEVMARVGSRAAITVSTKAWWLLGPFAKVQGVRTLKSAGNRIELALLLWMPPVPFIPKVDGAVVHRRLLTERMIKRLLARGLLFTWAVEDRATVTLFDHLGVSGVILDDLRLIPDR